MVSTVHENAAHRRRGRPYRFPEDSTPLTQVHGGVAPRVSWLLSASRIHATDRDLAQRDHFVEALKRQGDAADLARVSRWESGSLRVPGRVIASYEKALGLTPGHLGAAIHGVRRSLEPAPFDPEPTSASPERLHQDLDRLFERVDRDTPTGWDWLALTDYLAAHPGIYLLPKSWQQIAEALIGELSRAAGPAYVRRFEALRTLIRHPGAQRHVAKAVVEYTTDPAAQVLAHPLTLLQEVQHPHAGKVMMHLLANGADTLQQAAAWVTAAKLSRGHFDEPDAVQLEHVLVGLLCRSSRTLSDADLLDVVARLPQPAIARIQSAIRNTPAGPRLELLLTTGETLPTDITRHVAARVSSAAQEATPPPYRIEPDMMLQRLIREALFHGHAERRHQAATLLTVSPYRPAVAASLVHLVDSSDKTVAVRAASVLKQLATDSQREALLRWSADSCRPEVQGLALLTLGRLPGGVRPEEEPVVLAGLGVQHVPIQRASVYALGMVGASGLRQLAASEDERLRQAAGWWQRNGSAIHEPPTAVGVSDELG